MPTKAEIKLEVKGLKETQKRMEQAIIELNGEPFLNAMRDCVNKIQRDAKVDSPVDTGRLRASITPQIISMGNEVTGVVGSNVVYAAAMELGTKPHWVPIAPLIAWVHRKQMTGAYSIKTHRRMGGRKTQLSQDKSVAYAIQKSIAKKGTSARKYLQNSFNKNKDYIFRRFKRATNEVIKKANGENNSSPNV